MARSVCRNQKILLASKWESNGKSKRKSKRKSKGVSQRQQTSRNSRSTPPPRCPATGVGMPPDRAVFGDRRRQPARPVLGCVQHDRTSHRARPAAGDLRIRLDQREHDMDSSGIYHTTRWAITCRQQWRQQWQQQRHRCQTRPTRLLLRHQP